jgi:misacylated tRNA(Ala) deacylase
MPTELLFRDDAYLRECTARVVGLSPTGGIILDRTVFYATSGGQPGDQGVLVSDGGESIPVAGAIHSDAAKTEVEHVLAEGARAPQVGEPVTARLDWSLRYPRMRMHTALHLLSAALPYPVTGGSIGNLEGRLDFDIPDAGLEKDAINAKLAEMIATDAEVRTRWISEEELAVNPGLIKTMSVKPPMGAGRVRLVEICGLDLQPCGGTHVARTSEIGCVRVSQIEKKGKLNRRVRLVFAEQS